MPLTTAAIDISGSGYLDVVSSYTFSRPAIVRNMPDWQALHSKELQKRGFMIFGTESLPSSGNLTFVSARRNLSDEEIQMFDAALVASSRLLFSFKI